MFHPFRRIKPLLPREIYLRKVARAFFGASAVIFISLLIGVWGYWYFGNLHPIDALLNAAMILTGMGPVNAMTTTGGKLFASFYALYSGIAFITTVGVMFSPVFHRFLHRFHIETEFVEEDSMPEREAKNR